MCFNDICEIFIRISAVGKEEQGGVGQQPESPPHPIPLPRGERESFLLSPLWGEEKSEGATPYYSKDSVERTNPLFLTSRFSCPPSTSSHICADSIFTISQILGTLVGVTPVRSETQIAFRLSCQRRNTPKSFLQALFQRLSKHLSLI